jgi:hypothetical protein
MHAVLMPTENDFNPGKQVELDKSYLGDQMQYLY